MTKYSKKQRWKLGLFICAILIGASSMIYTGSLVRKLQQEERKKVKLYAEAMKEASNASLDDDVSILVYQIISNNKTIPVIWVGENGEFINSTNINTKRVDINEKLEYLRNNQEPIEIKLSKNKKQYIYYEESTLLTALFYYPYIQLTVICLFIFVAYLTFSTSRKSEQNQVWVGMSKETAHQLGTPISSLMAWIEMLKLKNVDKVLIDEVTKDVDRLQTITERFSKIGAVPVLNKINIIEILNNSIEYLKLRTSQKVEYIINYDVNSTIMIPINVALFEWVIENLCKNAIDAMNGSGKITVNLKDDIQLVYIDVSDMGKGIPKSKYKTVFQPGFTTKKRGWGLGLSLAKRIIEINHGGKMFVKNSEINKGTTFRIVLKK